MILSFWVLIALIFYTYFGYPLILLIIAKFKNGNIRKEEVWPTVSIIISAHNEEKSIKDKLENTLNLDYPKDKLEIIVASDGSIDQTDNIVNSFRDSRIKLISFKERKGKTAVQNEAVKSAKGEIILFSDATTNYDPQLLKNIVRNFSDTNVGAVGGELVYMDRNKSLIGEESGFYWKYEKFLKKKESRITSLIGVSGCCYALRKDLYKPIRPDLISDFVIAQMIYKDGKKVIYEPDAVSYEDANSSSKDEFKMRVRVAVRTLFGICYMKSLLNPFKYGFYSLQLISHKILRYMVPVFLVILLLLNIAINTHTNTLIYKVSLYLQLIFYFTALLGFILRNRKNPFQISYYFCLTNFALLIGMLRFLSGERKVLWKPLRK